VAGALVYGLLTQVLWQEVLPRFARYPIGRRVACQTAVALLGFAALSFVLAEVHPLLLGGHSILQPYTGGDKTVVLPADAIRQAPLIFAFAPVIPAVVIIIVGFNLHWWRIRLLQGRQEELRELAVSAQLAALRAQVNPHFLFNSLNSIAQLIATDPPKAEVCVERLGDIYRYLLHRAHNDFVPLAEELSVAESYLEIERARFGDALTVEARIDVRARGLLLPSLILQPLVENAIKHGLARKVGPGSLTIRSHSEHGRAVIEVEDDGMGFVLDRLDQPMSSGIGLANVRERLHVIYGAAYRLSLFSEPGKGTRARIEVPELQTEARITA
jgi:two-component system LytT family sensor kinase